MNSRQKIEVLQNALSVIAERHCPLDSDCRVKVEETTEGLSIQVIVDFEYLGKVDGPEIAELYALE